MSAVKPSCLRAVSKKALELRCISSLKGFFCIFSPRHHKRAALGHKMFTFCFGTELRNIYVFRGNTYILRKWEKQSRVIYMCFVVKPPNTYMFGKWNAVLTYRFCFFLRFSVSLPFLPFFVGGCRGLPCALYLCT